MRHAVVEDGGELALAHGADRMANQETMARTSEAAISGREVRKPGVSVNKLRRA
jgi:hypothetical protein